MVALPPIFHVGSNAPSSQVWSGPRGAALTVVVVAADRPPVRVEEVHTVGSLPLQEASGLFDHASVSVVEPDQDRPPVSYTHLRAHETKAKLVCRLLLEKKK